jgi:hypothetical protein
MAALNPEFKHARRVLTWIATLERRHPEQRELLETLAEQVRTRRDSTLHYGALGLRFQIDKARTKGDCSGAFAARAEAVLWGLEVIAADDMRFGLPVAVITDLVTTALECRGGALRTVARAIDIAERLRWHEWDEARQLLARYDARPSRDPIWQTVIARLRRLARRAPNT